MSACVRMCNCTNFLSLYSPAHMGPPACMWTSFNERGTNRWLSGDTNLGPWTPQSDTLVTKLSHRQNGVTNIMLKSVNVWECIGFCILPGCFWQSMDFINYINRTISHTCIVDNARSFIQCLWIHVQSIYTDSIHKYLLSKQ